MALLGHASVTSCVCVHFGAASGLTLRPSGVLTTMSWTRPSGKPCAKPTTASVLGLKSVKAQFGCPAACVNHFDSVVVLHWFGDCANPGGSYPLMVPGGSVTFGVSSFSLQVIADQLARPNEASTAGARYRTP